MASSDEPHICSFDKGGTGNYPSRHADVFIAGCGPIGATFAARIHEINPKAKILMVDIGAVESEVPGSHKRNTPEFQKDMNRFVDIIKGALKPCSIPPSYTPVSTLDPDSFAPYNQLDENGNLTSTNGNIWYTKNGQNPEQLSMYNLGAESVTRVVGGMSTHWTTVCPELHCNRSGETERPRLHKDNSRDNDIWKSHYEDAKKLLRVSDQEFEGVSIRHLLTKKTLQEAFPDRGIESLPLACHREKDNRYYVAWHAFDTILESMGDPLVKQKNGEYTAINDKYGTYLTLLSNIRCTGVCVCRKHATAKGNHTVRHVLCKDLRKGKKSNFLVTAKVYVLATGAVSTPQILFKSDFASKGLAPALGKYMTEHTMAFCQIVLKSELVKEITNYSPPKGSRGWKKPQWWINEVEKHKKKYPLDPVPMSFLDPEPQVRIPFRPETPWHGQVQRDTFYGEIPNNIDDRVVVDLRFYGRCEPVERNVLTFSDKYTDAYGMPQPTFFYIPTEQTRQEAHDMMEDMTKIALKLGGFLPGSEPRFMEMGTVPHISGTTRVYQPCQKHVDKRYRKNSAVVDRSSKVYDVDNLFLGGNGLLPTMYAANPTLTSMAYAVKSATKIARRLLPKAQRRDGCHGGQQESAPAMSSADLDEYDEDDYTDDEDA